MNGYNSFGIILFFTTFIVLACILWRTHGIKVDLEDPELKRAALIIRLRNVALILGMFAISAFLIMRTSIPLLSTYLLYVGLALLIAAAYLRFVSKKPEFNFERLLQQYAVKEKLAAMLKFSRKPAPKPKRRNRV